MNLVTLFSGIGVPELAAKRVFKKEFNNLFACEIDKFARQSYLANHEIDEANFYHDINELNAKPFLGKVDILVGGSPCQDFSIAGLRTGVNGKRGALIWQYYRIISECKPRIFIYENVKGMLSDRGGATLKEFLEVFRNLGYHCHAEVLNTKNYGIPQNRERIYITGFLNTDWYHAFSYAPKQPLELNLGDMLEKNVDKKYTLSQKIIKGFLKKENSFSGSFKVKTPINIASAITTKAGQRRTDNFIKVIGELDIKRERNARVYAKDGISPTIMTQSGGGHTPKIPDNNEIRILTPRECLRLQGIDDSFKIVVSDCQAYKQAGNAMSQNILEMIFKQINLAKNNEFRLRA